MSDDLERAPTADLRAAATTRNEKVGAGSAKTEATHIADVAQPPRRTGAYRPGGGTRRYGETPATEAWSADDDSGPVEPTPQDPSAKPPPQDTAGPRADSRLLTDRDEQLLRQEHLATVGRLRRILPWAVVLWVGFFFVDFVLATWVVPGPLWPYLALRLVGVLPIASVLVLLRRDKPPSPRSLAACDIVMTSSSAGILAVMCLLSGGLRSPFVTYIAMVIAGRAAVWPNPWRVGMWRLGVPALASPVVLALALPWSPALRTQLSDSHAVATYFFFLMLIFGAWVLLVIGSHNAWTLRRQVFTTRSIGRYRLERRIGRGGMGEVWLAWHDQLRRKVALKILRPDAGTDPGSVARFEREVMATAALAHPNTVRIFDHGVTDDGLWYYAMELLEGEDLHRLVARDGEIEPARAVALLRQAAGAIGEAHRRRIVHRDLKPENLFIAQLGGEADFVKVLDFGIARVTNSAETRLTGTGWVAGTPAYLSPEAATGSEVGPPGDVYGLGAVLYFAVTGSPPFAAANSMALMQLHVSAAVESPSDRLGIDLPDDLEAVILRCLEKDPEDRFADADELAAALDALSLEETSGASG
ncbi:MAG: protein kinase, partial [Myxococcota bacterium]